MSGNMVAYAPPVMTATCFACSTEELWPCIVVILVDTRVLGEGIDVHVDDKVVTSTLHPGLVPIIRHALFPEVFR